MTIPREVTRDITHPVTRDRACCVMPQSQSQSQSQSPFLYLTAVFVAPKSSAKNHKPRARDRETEIHTTKTNAASRAVSNQQGAGA